MRQDGRGGGSVVAGAVTMSRTVVFIRFPNFLFLLLIDPFPDSIRLPVLLRLLILHACLATMIHNAQTIALPNDHGQLRVGELGEEARRGRGGHRR